MRVVVLVPRRPDGGRRDHIWMWVRQWLDQQHPEWPLFEGTHDGDVFSMAAARNDAARKAGDWDVAVIVDSDTIAHPDAVQAAVTYAHHSRKVIVAGDYRIRCDQPSSDRILNGELGMFTRPEGERHPKGNSLPNVAYGEPSSGVLAIGRPLWDATGGYLESMRGWGFEDLVFLTQCFVVGDGMDWVRDTPLLHFWHPRTPTTQDTTHNEQVWRKLHRLSCTDKDAAKQYLRGLGHQW